MIVFDREGNFLRSWGEGVFTHAHGIQMLPDDTMLCTDDGDHTVRQCTLDGKVLMTIGVPGKPSPFMSGKPFCRCTHTALSPKGEIYVSDGYGNAQIHRFTPDGKYISSWGKCGCLPGEFNLPHNIHCDADGWVYVADRENHRIQVFDGNGKFETQWTNVHRPSAMCLTGGALPAMLRRRDRAVSRVESRVSQSRAADQRAERQGRAAGADRARGERARAGARAVHVAARDRGRFARRHLCRRGFGRGLAVAVPGRAAAGRAAQPAEAGQGIATRLPAVRGFLHELEQAMAGERVGKIGGGGVPVRMACG